MNLSFAQNVSLPNTLALESRARRALVATSVDQLQAAVSAFPTETLFILGGGSNVVLPDELSGLTVLMRIKGIVEQPASGGDRRIFDVGAGESWQGFVRFCVGQGLGCGIENLTLIPGTVGAAPIQKIGAYGVEVAQFILAVQVIDLQSPEVKPIWLSVKDCAFAYRDSRFKQQPGRWLITRVRFAMHPHEAGSENLQYEGVKDALERQGCTRLNPAAISEAVARLRRSKLPDPRTHPNAGSFFKNPVCSEAELRAMPAEIASKLESIPSWPHENGRKFAAAALIDRAGFKRRLNAGNNLDINLGIGVWYRQPLVLVNYGGADAKSVGQFADEIRRTVSERFAMRLEQEPINIKPV